VVETGIYGPGSRLLFNTRSQVRPQRVYRLDGCKAGCTAKQFGLFLPGKMGGAASWAVGLHSGSFNELGNRNFLKNTKTPKPPYSENIAFLKEVIKYS